MRRIVTAIIFGLSLALAISAQTKPPVTPADYGQFETLATVPSRGGLSPDGKWLAYGINRSNRNNELRIANVADGTTKVAAFGAQPVFSADSRWVAYAVGMSDADEEKLKKAKKKKGGSARPAPAPQPGAPPQEVLARKAKRV